MVRFRHFFLADVITSLVLPLKDVGYIGCFFIQGGWLEHSKPTVEDCPIIDTYMMIIGFLPYWFRLA